MSEENVLVITVEETVAQQALETLKHLASEDGFELRGGAIVHRSDQGRIVIEDPVGDVETELTLAERHPRLATLLTVLLGPIDTLLLGNSLVALVGAVAEPTQDELALAQLGRAIPLGGTAVIADIVESDPAVADRELAHLGATVARRPIAEVEAEIGVADQAITAAGAEARRVLRGPRSSQQ